ncbi:hypothetical protein SCOCK_140095 [Actinacidiphila cocklensis]|jgi:hypothetical protein|uniref:Uncharacterized protein n=1 Tax=Actinacidiphila cocklensis TaxID=887465 RepID=A0A9W4DKM1_9ACTN|nr:hypothetical protein SCOCK_140095 [Actinacidiphila cocklensis]
MPVNRPRLRTQPAAGAHASFDPASRNDFRRCCRVRGREQPVQALPQPCPNPLATGRLP